MTLAAAPSLDAYRQPHKIELMAGPDGLQYCRHCGIRCYSVVVPGHWLHDQAEIRRLREAEMLAALNGTPVEVAEPCFWCHRLAPILDGTYVRIALPGGEVVNVCDVCFERGQDDGGDDDGPYNTAAGHEHWGDE